MVIWKAKDRAKVKEAGLLKMVKRHMGLSSASTAEEPEDEEEDEVSSWAAGDGAGTSQVRQEGNDGDKGPDDLAGAAPNQG